MSPGDEDKVVDQDDEDVDCEKVLASFLASVDEQTVFSDAIIEMTDDIATYLISGD